MDKCNLVNGCIPAGELCFARDECTFKEMACNGEGCQVCKTPIKIKMSCGMARAFELIEKARDVG